MCFCLYGIPPCGIFSTFYVVAFQCICFQSYRSRFGNDNGQTHAHTGVSFYTLKLVPTFPCAVIRPSVRIPSRQQSSVASLPLSTCSVLLTRRRLLAAGERPLRAIDVHALAACGLSVFCKIYSRRNKNENRTPPTRSRPPFV